MTERNSRNDANGSGGQGDASGTTRRSVLKAASAGAAALTIGSGLVGSAAAHGMPTPPLERDGNKLVDPQCNEVILRGVNIADPVRTQRSWRPKEAPEIIDKAMSSDEDWHNYIIRVPMQPQDISSVNNNFKHAHGDDWGPLLPGQFSQSDLETYVQQYVKPLVDQTKENGAYIMLDYHRHFPIFHQPQNEESIGDYQCGNQSFDHDLGFCGERGVMWNGEDQISEFQSLSTSNSDYYEGQDNTVAQDLHDEIVMFWEYVANEFADEPHVIFDIYNEPTGPYAGDWGAPDRFPDSGDGEAGNQNWAPTSPEAEEYYKLWVDRAQPWVDVVEENAPGSVKTIGSPRWSQYTYWADEYEFDATNMCYTGHAYMQDDLRPLTERFGKPAENVPVFFSEWGWHATGGKDNFGFLEGTTSGAASEFEELFENYPVHPVAWNFDHTWEPAFFKHQQSQQNGNWVMEDYETAPGQWWKEYLQEKDGQDRPQAPTDSTFEGSSCGGNTTEPPTTEPPTTEPPTGDEQELSIQLASEQASADGTVDAEVKLANAPEGVSGYDLVVSVADTSVAQITEASYPEGWFNQGMDVASDGSQVTLTAVDGSMNVEAGASDVTLATVTLETQSDGETEVGVAVDNLDSDDNGAEIPVMTTGDVLTVSSISPINGTTPQDIDGDGHYMDLNANDEIDADDVVIYFNNYDQPAIQNHVEAYDYNDSGGIDFDDIVTLFQEY